MRKLASGLPKWQQGSYVPELGAWSYLFQAPRGRSCTASRFRTGWCTSLVVAVSCYQITYCACGPSGVLGVNLGKAGARRARTRGLGLLIRVREGIATCNAFAFCCRCCMSSPWPQHGTGKGFAAKVARASVTHSQVVGVAWAGVPACGHHFQRLPFWQARVRSGTCPRCTARSVPYNNICKLQFT
jgi:hypothetical protein